MAKVTVYVKDEQLKTLKEEMGGASKAFQAFIDECSTGERPIEVIDARGVRRTRRRRRLHRDDFASRIMPTASALERLVGEVADEIGDDGPRAASGPVSFALSVLTYKAVTARHPEVDELLAKEFTRFGLDELVEAAADGFDLEARSADGDDTDRTVEVRSFRVRKGGGDATRQVQIVVGSGDDPGELLDEADLASFQAAHPTWTSGSSLGGDELKTLSELLRRRFAEPSED